MDAVQAVLIVVCVMAVGGAIASAVRASAARSELQKAIEAYRASAHHAVALSEQLRRLAPYQAIPDAEAAATAIRSDAQTWAARATADARTNAEHAGAQARAVVAQAEAAAGERRAQMEAWAAQVTAQATAEAVAIRAAAQSWAENATADARRNAERTGAQARAIVAQAEVAAGERRTQIEAWAAQVTAQATAEAARVMRDAVSRADETAGEALAAARDAKRLEQVAGAMRRLIDGYGDQYVMPTAGLLDELADEFGFAEAGQKLKAARDATRAAIKGGQAATCEYVEPNRRTTAIEFVLDAFNGKVDTILADVRDDNHGTLQQRIRDAFVLVNENGRAFRDARILPTYLDQRLEELRWAVVAQELKRKEKEEQRLLKERIREEERAQREFERAMRDAQKEEDVLRKAMEKAQAEVAKATDAQRTEYEEQLRGLAERLRLAEEKNQRALSMAQQTRAGYVYIISNVGSFGEDVLKIGMTRRLEPLDRVRELGDASVPFEFDVHAMIRTEDAPALERTMHQRFARKLVNKVNFRKEFFRVSLHEVRVEVESLGIAASWTLAAEAREYRETQAIERSMADKSFDEAAWLSRRLREASTFTADPPAAEASA